VDALKTRGRIRAAKPPRASPRRASSLILLRVGEREPPGQRSFQVRFRELHLPAATKKERHVNRVVRFGVAGPGCSIGEHKAKMSTGMPPPWGQDAPGRVGRRTRVGMDPGFRPRPL
jgi:hypothetical protein